MATTWSKRNPAALELSAQMGASFDEELTSRGIECTMAEVSLNDESYHTTSSHFDDEERRMADSTSSSTGKRRRDNLRWTWCLWIMLALTIGATGALCVLLTDHLTRSKRTDTVAAASAYHTTENAGENVPEVPASEPHSDPVGTISDPGQGIEAVVIPDPNVNYLYASADTAKMVNYIGTGDFTLSVHIRGTEDAPQSEHPIILSNRNTNQYDESFLFGIHQSWRESLHKIPFVNLGGVNWIQYNHPNQPNVLDGVWHHFVARRKGLTLSYYVDGELVIDLTHEIFGASISSAPEQQDLIIGYDQFNPSATKFVGELRELTIWNTALPIQSIATGLQNLAGDEDALIAYFPTIPLDQSGEIASHAKASLAAKANQAPPPSESTPSSTTKVAPWP